MTRKNSMTSLSAHFPLLRSCHLFTNTTIPISGIEILYNIFFVRCLIFLKDLRGKRETRLETIPARDDIWSRIRGRVENFAMQPNDIPKSFYKPRIPSIQDFDNFKTFGIFLHILKERFTWLSDIFIVILVCTQSSKLEIRSELSTGEGKDPRIPKRCFVTLD